MKRFLQRILQEIMKKKILGTSETWSMSHLFQRPSDPAYYIEDCRILTNGGQQLWCCKQWLKFSKEIDQGATILSLTRFSKTKGWNHLWIILQIYPKTKKLSPFQKVVHRIFLERNDWLVLVKFNLPFIT